MCRCNTFDPPMPHTAVDSLALSYGSFVPIFQHLFWFGITPCGCGHQATSPDPIVSKKDQNIWSTMLVRGSVYPISWQIQLTTSWNPRFLAASLITRWMILTLEVSSGKPFSNTRCWSVSKIPFWRISLISGDCDIMGRALHGIVWRFEYGGHWMGIELSSWPGSVSMVGVSEKCGTCKQNMRIVFKSFRKRKCWDRVGCPVPASGAFLTCSSLHNQAFLALSLSLAFPTWWREWSSLFLHAPSDQ